MPKAALKCVKGRIGSFIAGQSLDEAGAIFVKSYGVLVDDDVGAGIKLMMFAFVPIAGTSDNQLHLPRLVQTRQMEL